MSSVEAVKPPKLTNRVPGVVDPEIDQAPRTRSAASSHDADRGRLPSPDIPTHPIGRAESVQEPPGQVIGLARAVRPQGGLSDLWPLH
ncbi:MAG TPA: hypothetical protein VNF50_08295, partial [Acidimicrobiales bacterium]|nr:hypothetical protein [Acidimicrobiales bacterium]